jgi:hypothetical protein
MEFYTESYVVSEMDSVMISDMEFYTDFDEALTGLRWDSDGTLAGLSLIAFGLLDILIKAHPELATFLQQHIP